MGGERQPPRVTVHDPSRPGRDADLLVSGDDEPPRPSPFTRRRLRAAGVVVLVLATAAGAVELRERRAAAAEERRLDRVLDLAVEPRSSSSSYDSASRVVTLDLQLRLRNDGPRDLVVERGSAGAYVLVQAMVEVGAGDGVPLLLRREVTCAPDAPPPPAPLEVLTLDLRTAAGPRQVELPVDPSLITDGAPRACGFLPLEEAVDVAVLAVARSERGVELVLQLTSRSVRDVDLAAVDAGPGLSTRVEVLGRGELLLPLGLPAQGAGGTRSTDLEVVVDVTDCTAARRAPAQLALRLTDDRGRVAQPLVGYDPTFLGGLLSEACSS